MMRGLTDASKATVGRYAHFKESVYISTIKGEERILGPLRSKKLLAPKMLLARFEC